MIIKTWIWKTKVWGYNQGYFSYNKLCDAVRVKRCTRKLVGMMSRIWRRCTNQKKDEEGKSTQQANAGCCHHLIHANVLEHSAPWLASRRPIWSDMTPVDISEQRREKGILASVINNVLVTTYSQDLITDVY